MMTYARDKNYVSIRIFEGKEKLFLEKVWEEDFGKAGNTFQIAPHNVENDAKAKME